MPGANTGVVNGGTCKIVPPIVGVLTVAGKHMSGLSIGWQQFQCRTRDSGGALMFGTIIFLMQLTMISTERQVYNLSQPGSQECSSLVGTRGGEE